MTDKIKEILIKHSIDDFDIGAKVLLTNIETIAIEIEQTNKELIKEIEERIDDLKLIHLDLKRKHVNLSSSYYAQLLEIEFLQSLLNKLK